jgi:hypothetical protein
VHVGIIHALHTPYLAVQPGHGDDQTAELLSHSAPQPTHLYVNTPCWRAHAAASMRIAFSLLRVGHLIAVPALYHQAADKDVPSGKLGEIRHLLAPGTCHQCC